jgi:hypothetical protein
MSSVVDKMTTFFHMNACFLNMEKVITIIFWNSILTRTMQNDLKKLSYAFRLNRGILVFIKKIK